MSIEYVDIIFGLQWGDEGKGKITNAIARNYDFVCRFNGGANAGHTIYLNGKKYKTHAIPSGIFQNKISVIGPNCVLNEEGFYNEVTYLEKEGFDVSLIKVSPKVHIISDAHIKYDKQFLSKKLGTTSKGIAPAYSDKMLRCGKLAKDIIDKKYLWDEKLYGKVLCEGAQSFWLDINQGDYPYVTSSETLPYSACSLGFSPKIIKDIIGIAKPYDTKSGVDPLFPDNLWGDKNLNNLIELGEEYGSTTGRKRLANWLRLDKLTIAAERSGANYIIFNKCDIIEALGLYKLFYDNQIVEFIDFSSMKKFIESKLAPLNITIKYSYSKNFI